MWEIKKPAVVQKQCTAGPRNLEGTQERNCPGKRGLGYGNFTAEQYHWSVQGIVKASQGASGLMSEDTV